MTIRDLAFWEPAGDYVPMTWPRLRDAEPFTESEKLSAVVRRPHEPESDAAIVARREQRLTEMLKVTPIAKRRA